MHDIITPTITIKVGLSAHTYLGKDLGREMFMGVIEDWARIDFQGFAIKVMDAEGAENSCEIEAPEFFEPMFPALEAKVAELIQETYATYH